MNASRRQDRAPGPLRRGRPGPSSAWKALEAVWRDRGIPSERLSDGEGQVALMPEPFLELEDGPEFPQPGTASEPAPDEITGVEVLVAEDNDDDSYLLREALSEVWAPECLYFVRDGEQALAFLRREGPYRRAKKPGLVVLDINMPRKDGLAVLRDMKRDPDLCHIPAVVLTTSDREFDVVRAYAQGAATFVTKPSSYDEFREIVEEMGLYWYLVARLPLARP